MTTDTTSEMLSQHPVLACVRTVDQALKDVAGVEPVFMSTPQKAAALVGMTELIDRLEELRLRVMAQAEDVAREDGARDVAAWLATQAHLPRPACRRLLRLARDLDQRYTRLRDALRDGAVNLAQAQTIAHALNALPDHLDPQVRELAESHLITQATHFGPRKLKILGRRVLQVVAPEVSEDEERRQLDAEEANAARRTFFTTRSNGDGTTDIRARVTDAIAARLLAYLEGFNSPRRHHHGQHPEPAPHEARPHPGHQPRPQAESESESESESEMPAEPEHEAEEPAQEPAQQPAQEPAQEPAEEPAEKPAEEPAEDPAYRPYGGRAPDDRRGYDQRLGHAFGAFLEAVDPARLPIHGGDATHVMITIDYAALCDQLGVGTVGDQPITADQIRRLACTADLLPAVLGTHSEILDLGRRARLFSPAQRRAMALRDTTCRGEGCDIPAPWCEAHHHTRPWAAGGNTDLDHGLLLCSFHHHKAHDHHYETDMLPDGRIRFRRRC